MLTKFKAFCKKPITWGAYFKLCGIAVVATYVTTAAVLWKMNRVYGQDWRADSE